MLLDITNRRQAYKFLQKCQLADYVMAAKAENKAEIKKPYLEILVGKEEASEKTRMAIYLQSMEEAKQKFWKGI